LVFISIKIFKNSTKMEGRIVNYRGSHRTQRTDQIIILIDEIKSKKEASKLLGKKVEWVTPSGKKIVGKITRTHGSKGEVVAKFKKGLPGQALGTKVKILV